MLAKLGVRDRVQVVVRRYETGFIRRGETPAPEPGGSTRWNLVSPRERAARGTRLLRSAYVSNMNVHRDAYVAPSAIVTGEISIGAGSCVLAGAILTADGGPIVVGSNCVIMEYAVIRGTRRHPTTIGDHVLIGPHAYLTGADVADEVFIATGSMIFNGARLDRASSVALGGAVHIGARLTSEQRLPIGWVAVGNPARMYPITAVDEIRAGLTEQGGFLPYVFGVEDTGERGPMMRAALQRYTAQRRPPARGGPPRRRRPVRRLPAPASSRRCGGDAPG